MRRQLLPQWYIKDVLFLGETSFVLVMAGQVLIAISSTTLLAEHTAEKERGRAYAANFAWTHTFWPITYPAIGHGVAVLGVPWTFTLAGIVCLIIAAITFLSLNVATDHPHEAT